MNGTAPQGSARADGVPPISHALFVRWVALAGACWLILQSVWWLWWLGTYSACTSPASLETRQSVLALGLMPNLTAAMVSLMLVITFWRLIARRSVTLGGPPVPVGPAIGLYIAQAAVFLLADGLITHQCLVDPAVATAGTPTARLFLLIWLAAAAVSLGLALTRLYRLLNDPASRD